MAFLAPEYDPEPMILDICIILPAWLASPASFGLREGFAIACAGLLPFVFLVDLLLAGCFLPVDMQCVLPSIALCERFVPRGGPELADDRSGSDFDRGLLTTDFQSITYE